MIIKTQAIVLNSWPFSETSQVVAWLTSDYGKIATIIKGAQRPKNFFLGRCDLFYTCELLFYLRLFQGLHIVKECFPLKNRPALRSYWPGTACASYFSSLVAKVTPLYAPQHGVYVLLNAALDFFAEEEKNLEISLYWFEMKLLQILGLTPVLHSCLQCRRPLMAAGAATDEKIYAAFSAARGGVLCAACHAKYKADAVRIAADTLALLRFWQSSHKTTAIRNTAYNERQIKEIGVLLGNFLQHHLETENTGRPIALAVLRKWREMNFQPLKM